MDGLPEDVFVEVLRRVPPRDLAASCRRVCRAWRAAVDSRRLLLPHVLPHALAGVFSNYCDYDCPHFFARPMGAAGPRIDGTFRSVRRGGGRRSTWDTVLDHCNGLVLYCRWSDVCVCNPATRRWARLPPPAPPDAMWDSCAYLAFDPSVSLHYQVVLIPDVPEGKGTKQQKEDDEAGQKEADEGFMEWPPSSYKLHVFSSATQAWEERVFVREGEAAGTIAEARLDSVEPALGIGPQDRYAEYWRGALYVHCRGAYVMRLSMSDGKFRVVKTPTNIDENKYTEPYFGRSEKGLYYAAIKAHELRVWRLYESQEQMEWVLKHHVDIGASCHIQTLWHYCGQIEGPWFIVEDSIVEDSSCSCSDEEDNSCCSDEEDKVEEVQERAEWNSDDDDILDIEQSNLQRTSGVLNFVGFHPYKEIVLLSSVSFRVFAYNLNSTKARYLGEIRPNSYRSYVASLRESFMYTPCLIDQLPGNVV